MKYLLSLTLSIVFAVQMNAQDKKVAVVTFGTDKIIGFEDLGIGSEELLTQILKLRDNPDFDLTPMLEKFHKEFFENYSKEFPFQILPEETVTSNPDYIAFKPKWDKDEDELKRFVVYPGYKSILEGFGLKYNEEGVAKIFANEADGVMFVDISYELIKGFGIGGTATVKMRANARMALYDKTGKKVYVIKEGANSKKTAMMVGGIPTMTTAQIMPMCESAFEELMDDLNKKLPKIIKKADKL